MEWMKKNSTLLLFVRFFYIQLLRHLYYYLILVGLILFVFPRDYDYQSKFNWIIWKNRSLFHSFRIAFYFD